jgi:soluble lytic murein transglycosylase-like protein
MPTTAAELGIDDPADPAQNLDGGARYLKQMLDQFGGDYGKALAAYNEGPGALSRSNGVPYPHETAPYVKKILSKAQAQ